MQATETRSQESWQNARAEHHAALQPFVDRHRSRRLRGESHPVEDFVWVYYSLRPGRLMLWSPGAAVRLEGADAVAFPDSAGFSDAQPNGRCLDPAGFAAPRRSSLAWILALLRKTQERAPFFGCLGLHEWAMVYELADVRHPQLPLRLSHAETRAVVESLPVRCSHHDAFRFFSQSARPLNALQPDLDQRQELEQPACLHANMDLLKWALKLGAWIPSDLMAAAFRLAMDARVIDMRASPYDVSGLGLEAIAIETPAGRRAYIAEQRRIHDLGLGLRARLIDAMQRLFTLTELAA